MLISSVADFIERHPNGAKEVQLWSTVLGVIFAIAALVAQIVGAS